VAVDEPLLYLIAGDRCDDHDVATYLGRVDAMKREFLPFASDK
jgi:hypothetical protein